MKLNKYYPARFIKRLFALLVLWPLQIAVADTKADLIHQAEQQRLNQQERDEFLRERQQTKPDIRIERPRGLSAKALLPEEDPCFVIKHIVLEGEAAEKFQWLLKEANRTSEGQADQATGRCLGTQGISLIMRRMQNAVIKQGFTTTKILAAPQNIASGTLSLFLVPGRIRNIEFQGPKSIYARAWNAVPIHSGDLLNLRDIEQALENFKRLPSVETDIKITPAQGMQVKPGESDLIITWQQNYPLRFSLYADDAGSESTGQHQGTAVVSWDHPLQLNDLFYTSWNQDLDGHPQGGSQGYNIHYSIPFWYWLFSLDVSENTYHQNVVSQYHSYDYSGESQNASIKMQHMLYRDAVQKMQWSLSGWQRNSKNFIEDAEIRIQRRRMAGWEFGLHYRTFIRQAIVNMDITYRQGTDALGALKAPEEDTGEGTSKPKIVKAVLKADTPFQWLGHSFALSNKLTMQREGTSLIPQDRFSLGSRHSIRGFDGKNQLASERGWRLRNDIYWHSKSGIFSPYLGVDYGQLAGPSSHALAGTSLSGAVVGIETRYEQFKINAFLGGPLSKPDAMKVSPWVAGFDLSWHY